MKNLAAQALKPVTLGPSVPLQQTRKTCWPAISGQETDSQYVGAEDSDSSASIETDNETSRLLGAEGGGWWYDQGKIIIETVSELKTKAPRKMVSIKDEPEIINESKKRKNVNMESRNNGQLRPLRSILKVGSNLSQSSAQLVNGNPMRKATLD